MQPNYIVVVIVSSLLVVAINAYQFEVNRNISSSPTNGTYGTNSSISSTRTAVQPMQLLSAHSKIVSLNQIRPVNFQVKTNLSSNLFDHSAGREPKDILVMLVTSVFQLFTFPNMKVGQEITQTINTTLITSTILSRPLKAPRIRNELTNRTKYPDSHQNNDSRAYESSSANGSIKPEKIAALWNNRENQKNHAGSNLKYDQMTSKIFTDHTIKEDETPTRNKRSLTLWRKMSQILSRRQQQQQQQFASRSSSETRNKQQYNVGHPLAENYNFHDIHHLSSSLPNLASDHRGDLTAEGRRKKIMSILDSAQYLTVPEEFHNNFLDSGFDEASGLQSMQKKNVIGGSGTSHTCHLNPISCFSSKKRTPLNAISEQQDMVRMTPPHLESKRESCLMEPRYHTIDDNNSGISTTTSVNSIDSSGRTRYSFNNRNDTYSKITYNNYYNLVILPMTSFLIVIHLWSNISNGEQNQQESQNADPLLKPISPEERDQIRDRIESMFYHGYNGYLNYASPYYDELKPIVCTGINTWGGYQLTLIDTLDTLIVLGNYTEFNRVANYIINNLSFDIDTNVSVFETNIRVVGGLLAAHLLSHKTNMALEMGEEYSGVPTNPSSEDTISQQKFVAAGDGWPCSGPLLKMAEDVARRLLPAFDTETGMPYGTVNLRHGVPEGETPVTCTAGIGTFLLEFGTLSRLTGDPIFEQKARKAIESLHAARSKINLPGNHINVQDSSWTAIDSGIGASVDSYFEYLIKGAAMFGDNQLASWFGTYLESLVKHTLKADWWLWVRMDTGQVTMPVFQSLESFWPGLLTLIGDIEQAERSMYNYEGIIKKYGFLPEIYDIALQKPMEGREAYPLRPEFVESLYYLYRATKDPQILKLGANLVETIEHSSRTNCGYATINNIINHTIEDRMESFYLAETLKYLYLLFSEEKGHFVWNDGSHGKIFKNPHTGKACIADAGGYVFTTEAHLLDPGLLDCCSRSNNNGHKMSDNNKSDKIDKPNTHEGTILDSNKDTGYINGATRDEISKNETRRDYGEDRKISKDLISLLGFNSLLKCPTHRKSIDFSLSSTY